MPGSPGMPAPPYQMRKDLSFPPDCVEVTHPVMTKKRKIVSKDLCKSTGTRQKTGCQGWDCKVSIYNQLVIIYQQHKVTSENYRIIIGIEANFY